jgi:hypothetical protein
VTAPARWSPPSRRDPHAEPEPQLSLLSDYRERMVEAATDAGVKKSRISNPDDFDLGLEVVQRLANRGGIFTADDARAEGAPAHVLGAVFRTLASRGVIVFAGTTTSTTISSHQRLTRQWRSAT